MDEDPKYLRNLSEAEKKKVYKCLEGQERKKMKALLYGKSTTREMSELGNTVAELFKTTEADSEERLAETAKIFAKMKDPFSEFLDLYRHHIDVHLPLMASAAGQLLKSFGVWTENRVDYNYLLESHSTPEFQQQAILTFTAFHTAHIDLAQKIFKLDKEAINNVIRHRIKKNVLVGKYKEAIELSKQFDMGKTFAFKAYILPRLLQDNYQEVREHCKGIKKHESKLIKFYDDCIYGLLSDRKNYLVDRYGCHMDMEKCFDRLSSSSCKKKVKDLLAYYGYNDAKAKDLAPSYFWKARESEITYAVRERFSNEACLDHDSYVSKIKSLMESTGMDRKLSLIKLVWSEKNEQRKRDAIAWSLIYNIPRTSLPNNVRGYMQENARLIKEISDDVFKVHSTETPRDLEVDGKPIIFVDDVPSLQKLRKQLLQEKIIGIDTETISDLIIQSKLALVQIAAKDAVYLVDFYKFTKEAPLSPETRDEFLTALLLGDGIKLGFDFINDLRLMTIQDKVQNNRCLCIKRLMENILDVDPDFCDLTDGNRKLAISLSIICERLLNQTLDKAQQKSNWALRPLKEEQMKYAAMDAEILLKLFEKIKTIAIERNLNFDELFVSSMSDVDKPAKKKEAKRKIDSMLWSEVVDILNEPSTSSGRSPSEVRCAVDLMVTGLGYQLRRCGIDTLIPKDHMEMVNRAKKDSELIIFTSGKAWERLNSEFPQRVKYVSTDEDPIQQTKEMLKKLNIKLNKEDVFTRCKDCNHLGFVVIPSPVVQALHDKAVICANLYNKKEFPLQEWKTQLKQLDYQDYLGYGCEVDPSDDYFQVNVYEGRIDIIRNLFTTPSLDVWKSSEIKYVPTNAMIPGRLFYLCPNCGKYYYE